MSNDLKTSPHTSVTLALNFSNGKPFFSMEVSSILAVVLPGLQNQNKSLVPPEEKILCLPLGQ